MSSLVKSSQTAKFSVLDPAGSKIDHVGKATGGGGAAKRDQTRANKESGERMAGQGLIGGPFTLSPNPLFVESRAAYFDRLYAQHQATLSSLPDQSIAITLPNGDVKSGVAFKTTPLDIALAISKGLADAVIIAKVTYTNRLEKDLIVACDEDDEAEAEKAKNSDETNAAAELWDLHRPLVGDCAMSLLKFDDPEAKTVSINLFTIQ